MNTAMVISLMRDDHRCLFKISSVADLFIIVLYISYLYKY